MVELTVISMVEKRAEMMVEMKVAEREKTKAEK